MSANVKEAVNRRALIADYDNVVPTNTAGYVVAAFWNVVNVTDELPTLQKQGFVLEFEKLRIAVGPGG